MKLKQVSVDLVDVPEVRVTAVYDEEHLKLLRESLAAMGTVNPIIVVAHDGRYEVVDGLHRLQEARSRGEPTISAVVYEGSAADSLLMNLVLNKVRGKTKASEMVRVVEALWKTYGLDSDSIAAKTGLTRDYIEKLQRISTAAPSVQQALDQEIIGVGVAYELARLPAHTQQEEICAKYQIWRFSVKELHEQVDNVIRLTSEAQAAHVGAVPKEQPAPPIYRCEGCHAELDPRYLKAVAICPDCFGHVWRLAKATEQNEVKIEQQPGGG